MLSNYKKEYKKMTLKNMSRDEIEEIEVGTIIKCTQQFKDRINKKLDNDDWVFLGEEEFEKRGNLKTLENPVCDKFDPIPVDIRVQDMDTKEEVMISAYPEDIEIVLEYKEVQLEPEHNQIDSF